MNQSRYIIGIDLGTTNSSLSYIDLESKTLHVQPFLMTQFSGVGSLEKSSSLPSFCYLSKKEEFPKNSMRLPWEAEESDILAGLFAKKEGAKSPLQLVQSAKSWLCHLGASRDPILPPLEESSRKISPVEATKTYLKMIRGAWNHQIAKGNSELEFEHQDIILTVPASFDEVARQLTVEAAKLAGFLSLTLLEEPQSAFYSFMEAFKGNFEDKFKEGETILVVDVGGGTTDFSLLVAKNKSQGITFDRNAVGDHLLLGGDNMDAFLASLLERKVKRPTKEQRFDFYLAAREAKEELLSSSKSVYRSVLQNKGSKVIEGSVSVEISKEELEEELLKGFFAFCPFDETKEIKRGGLRTWGLPFESEPSIIKHLGHFLHQAKLRSPDYILFNGGAMKPKIFQEAITGALNSWFPEKKVEVLPSLSLDLAVSRGAAYFGKARKGLGFKISGGSSKGYYLKVETKQEKEMAICLLAKGAEEGFSYKREEPFLLLPNKPALFQLYASHVRLDDKPGDLVAIEEEEMLKLPPIQTVLHFGKTENRVPVFLTITLTPIGTLEIGLESTISQHKWALEFQLKNASLQEDAAAFLNPSRQDETFDLADLAVTKEAISEAFSKEGKSEKLPEKLMEQLETLLERPRQDFPISILRSFFDTLFTFKEGRHFSHTHKNRFFNLAGFFLRPGRGYPLDDFRMKNVWKLLLSESEASVTREGEIQKLIFFRRIAAGLNKGQQMQLYPQVMPELKNGKLEIKKGESYLYSEKIRAFASFELIEAALKVKMGHALLERIQKGSPLDADYFALGRLGARHLSYGAFSHLIPVKVVTLWIQKLLEIKDLNLDKTAFLFSQLARKTDLAEFNIEEALRDKILQRFEATPHYNMLSKSLLEISHLTEKEQSDIFGESLPIGLSLY